MSGLGRPVATLGVVIALASAFFNWVAPSLAYCSTCSWTMLNFYRYWSYWIHSYVAVSVLFALPVLLFSWLAAVISGLIEIKVGAIKYYPGLFGTVALLATIPLANYYSSSFYTPVESSLGVGFYLGAAAVILFFVAYIVSKAGQGQEDSGRVKDQPEVAPLTQATDSF